MMTRMDARLVDLEVSEEPAGATLLAHHRVWKLPSDYTTSHDSSERARKAPVGHEDLTHDKQEFFVSEG